MAKSDVKFGRDIHNAELHNVFSEYTDEHGDYFPAGGGMNSTSENIGPDFANKSKGYRDFTKGVNQAKAEASKPKGPKLAKGGKVSSASKRADGCVIKGKTKGTLV